MAELVTGLVVNWRVDRSGKEPKVFVDSTHEVSQLFESTNSENLKLQLLAKHMLDSGFDKAGYDKYIKAVQDGLVVVEIEKHRTIKPPVAA